MLKVFLFIGLLATGLSSIVISNNLKSTKKASIAKSSSLVNQDTIEMKKELQFYTNIFLFLLAIHFVYSFFRKAKISTTTRHTYIETSQRTFQNRRPSRLSAHLAEKRRISHQLQLIKDVDKLSNFNAKIEKSIPDSDV